jgi:hypothetical protein
MNMFIFQDVFGTLMINSKLYTDRTLFGHCIAFISSSLHALGLYN